jgi:hypothetical protein
LWAAWGVLGLIMIASNRYLKVFYRVHIWIHILGGAIILIVTLVLGGIAIEEVGKIDTGYLHPIIGFIIFILSIIITTGGLIAKYTMVTLKWKSKVLLVNKMGHKVFAYLVLALG